MLFLYSSPYFFFKKSTKYRACIQQIINNNHGSYLQVGSFEKWNIFMWACQWILSLLSKECPNAVLPGIQVRLDGQFILRIMSESTWGTKENRPAEMECPWGIVYCVITAWGRCYGYLQVYSLNARSVGNYVSKATTALLCWNTQKERCLCGSLRDFLLHFLNPSNMDFLTEDWEPSTTSGNTKKRLWPSWTL